MYPKPEELKTGNIILCRTLNSTEAKVIQWCLDSEWNHAVVVIRLGNEILIAEAKGGSASRPLLYQEWQNSREREVMVLPYETDLKSILLQLGKGYDYGSPLAFGLKKVSGLEWMPRSEETVYCFEFAALCNGLPQPWGATPQYLEKEIKTTKTR